MKNHVFGYWSGNKHLMKGIYIDSFHDFGRLNVRNKNGKFKKIVREVMKLMESDVEEEVRRQESLGL